MKETTQTNFMIAALIACLVAMLFIVGGSRPAYSEPYAGVSIATSTGDIGAQTEFIREKGIIAGVFLGHNYKFDNGAMLGAEADISWSGVSGSLKQGDARVRSSSGYAASIRARAGMYINEELLLYATAGIAFDDKTVKAVSGGEKLIKDRPYLGLVLGAGAEYAITKTIGLRGEIRHTQYQDFDFFGENLTSSTTMIGAGIVFRLN